jgi:phytoene dehydrogenase-like protein
MDSSQIYDAIVVGSGIAGLTTAAYLCRDGIRTLVCERGESYGGLVNSFDKDGFTFDGGIRAFENSGIIIPMLDQLGIDLEFVKNPVSIGIGEDIITLESKESLKDYQLLLERNFPSAKDDIAKIIDEIKKIMQYMDILYGIDNPLFLDSYSDTQYVINTLLPWLAKYRKTLKQIQRLQMPVTQYLRSFTSNQVLIDCIAQHFFKDTPAFFAMSYFGLYLDYTYPKGGTGLLADKMATYILERGGMIAFDTEITSIDVDEREIKAKDGRTYSYEKLIWAADMKSLYRSVLPESIANEKKRKFIGNRRALVEHSHGGDSILSIFIATSLDSEYVKYHCGAHAFYTPSRKGLHSIDLDRWKAIVENSKFGGQRTRKEIESYIKDYFACTTYEISCPVLRDNSLAPRGQTGLIISTLFEYDLVAFINSSLWYEDFKEFCIKTALGVLQKRLFPDLSEHVLFSICSTPLTIEQRTHSSEGAITGWAFTNTIIPSEGRFAKIAKSIKTPLKDIYQAGQWTFSPSGLPVSALTGRLAAREVSKKLK